MSGYQSWKATKNKLYYLIQAIISCDQDFVAQKLNASFKKRGKAIDVNNDLPPRTRFLKVNYKIGTETSITLLAMKAQLSPNSQYGRISLNNQIKAMMFAKIVRPWKKQLATKNGKKKLSKDEMKTLVCIELMENNNNEEKLRRDVYKKSM